MYIVIQFVVQDPVNTFGNIFTVIVLYLQRITTNVMHYYNEYKINELLELKFNHPYHSL